MNGEDPHFVVVTKVGRRSIKIVDPAAGRRILTYSDFNRIWSGYLVAFERKHIPRSANHTASFGTLLLVSVAERKREVILAIIASIVVTALGVIAASYYRVLVDTILPSGARSTLGAVSAGLMLVAVFRATVRAVRNRVLLGFTARVDVDLSHRFLRHLFGLPLSFFELRRTGDVISRIADLSKIRKTLSRVLFEILFDVAMVLVIGIVLWSMDPPLFLTSSAILIVSVAVGLTVSRSYSRLHREALQRVAATHDYVIETVQNMDIVKSHNASSVSLNRAIDRLIDSRTAMFRAGAIENVQNALGGLVEGVGIAIVFWIGSSRVLDGDFTLGTLIAFNALLTYFYGPVLQLVSAQSPLQEGIEAGRRATEILTLEPEESISSNSAVPDGDISIQAVDFGYGGRANCLHSISIHIPKASWVSIVGPSGSGKSTIAKLLLRFYEPRSGSISIGDFRLSDIPVECVRSAVGYVSQETTLFTGTIAENIAYGISDVPMPQVIAASKLADAHSFIQLLPNGYSTRIGESGIGLSGGERQRVAIARALFRKPNVLVLDEATSDLDSASELRLLSALDEVRHQGSTLISIAHRLRTAQQSDFVVFLTNGRVRDMGRHQDLIARDDAYGEMWGGGESRRRG